MLEKFHVFQHARKLLAVRIRPSPGSRRSITSPRDTASYLHSFSVLKFNCMIFFLPFIPSYYKTPKAMAFHLFMKKHGFSLQLYYPLMDAASSISVRSPAGKSHYFVYIIQQTIQKVSKINRQGNGFHGAKSAGKSSKM